MTRDHDPFTRALTSLRERVCQNAYGAGQPIVIVEEARRLNVSVTPVREALSCLSGEGFVERAASGGYFAPRLDAGIIRDRYRFQLTCLSAALVRVAPAGIDRGVSPVISVRTLFDQIVSRSGSLALNDAYGRISALLSMFAGAERVLFADIREEAGELYDRHNSSDRHGLAETLERYHARRIGRAADLLTALSHGDPAELVPVS